MVVRTRLRAILFPVIFYALSGVASAYFVQTALNGERGLKTKDEYKRQIFALRQDFDRLKTERAPVAAPRDPDAIVHARPRSRVRGSPLEARLRRSP